VHSHGFLDHGHGDGDYGHRRVRKPSSAIGWALLIVLGFAGVEALVGWLSGSLALLSDAVHMGTDGIALALAWTAQRVARRRPTAKHSFGFERVETLAAFVNGVFYLALLAAIGVEAVHRLIEPQAIDAAMALPVAVLGLLINGVMLWMLHGERDQINARAALLHVIGDFAGSVIAIVAITLAWTTGWTRADPLLSLLLCLLMLVSTWRVLRDSSRVLMNAAPESLDVQAAGQALLEIEGVRSVHDLHIWELGGGRTALAAHLRVEGIEQWPEVLGRVRECMRGRFGIEHLTLQPEVSAAGDLRAEIGFAPSATRPSRIRWRRSRSATRVATWRCASSASSTSSDACSRATCTTTSRSPRWRSRPWRRPSRAGWPSASPLWRNSPGC
jgi:cobalt-zinc-cadmium efflux system protein